MRWWQEWRAWVAAKQDERERDLEKQIKVMIDSMKAPESPYRVESIIARVREHDRRGIR